MQVTGNFQMSEMQLLKTSGCFVIITFYMQCIYCQHVLLVKGSGNGLLFNTTEFIRTDSGVIMNYHFINTCKNILIKSSFFPTYINMPLVPVVKIYKEPVKPKFIIIHGNISYDFFYRSKIDTPFNQENLQQHTERVWLDVLIKEKYPFKIGFTARQSNSPFYRDLYNVNMNFDRHGYTKNIKQELVTRLAAIKWKNPDLALLEAALKEQLKRYQSLQNDVNGPEALQKLIEAKERVYYNKQKKGFALPGNQAVKIPNYKKIKLNNGQLLNIKTDSLIDISTADILPEIDSSYIKRYQEKKNELDSLKKSIALLKHQSDSVKKEINQNIAKVKQTIYKASNTRELEKIANEQGIGESKEKLQKFLSNIKTLGIGRSLVDYTELTAQNVMLKGVNVEYNPSYYVAAAVGKIDYGFRDLFGRRVKQRNQYLLLGRVGWGDKEKRTVILTVFNGRKNNYGGILAADSSNNTSKLFGYSVEVIMKKNENTFFSVEVAKSTKTRNRGAQASANKSDNLFTYSDDSNMGLNLKGQTIVPETDTRISGFFRKTGEEFQSFSLFTYNTNQQAWQLRVDQSFLKRKINLTAMLRQNDFTSPLTDKTFKTTTVFKSIQLNIRFPHWPTINAGYYPGSQFYVVDKHTVRENAYYILNGSVLHAYRVKGLAMNSSFVYNRFFNQATDSGFVLYKGVNYILSQSLLLKQLQLEAMYSYNKQSELSYYTLDANADYSLNKIFRLGAGIKYNHVQGGENYWGETMRLGVDLKKIGSLQFYYEKSFLPTIQRNLYPVETGRVSWYKTF